VAVSCPTSTDCYAVGDLGTILKSTDGGATWTYQTSNDPSTLMGLSCPSDNVCYASDIFGAVDTTTNGGATWTLTFTPAWFGTGTLTKISCSDNSTCAAVGVDSAGGNDWIVTTSNGGSTWTQRAASTSNGLYGVNCVATTTDCVAVGAGGSVLTTSDMTTWTAGTGNTTNFLNGVTCTSSTACTASGAGDTVDTLSGGTWTPAQAVSTDSTSTLADITCVDANDCTTVGSNGFVATLTIGSPSAGKPGAHARHHEASPWVQRAGGSTDQNIDAIDCASVFSCAAVGSASATEPAAILGTTDSGQTWLSQTNPAAIGVPLLGVSCANTENCVAVGGGIQVVNATWNSGTQHVTITFAGPAPVAALGSTVKVTGIEPAGYNGSFTILAESSTQILVGLASNPGNYAGGGVVTASNGAGLILTTPDADFGTSTVWTAQTPSSATGVSQTSVSCLASGTCIAGQTDGNLDVGTSGGSSWATVSPASGTDSVNAITCPNLPSGNPTCDAATSGGNVLQTTNSGTSFSVLPTGTAHELSAITCPDTGNCFAAGSMGTVVQTNNAGTTWTQQYNALSGPSGALTGGVLVRGPGKTPLSSTNTAIGVQSLACTTFGSSDPTNCVGGSGSSGNMLETNTLTVTLTLSSTYGSTPASASGLLPSDPAISYNPSSQAGNVTGTLTCTDSVTSSSAAGTYPFSNCSGLSDPGYSIVYDYENSAYTVDQADLLIVADDQSVTFGDTMPAFTWHGVGFVPGENSSSLTTQPTCTSTATTDGSNHDTSPAGTYPITCSGAVDPNYDITYQSGTLTVHLSGVVLTYNGPTTIGHGDKVTFKGTLKSTAGAPIAGRNIHFVIREGSTHSQSCFTGPTNVSGQGSCSLNTLKLPAGKANLFLTFNGDPTGPQYDYAPGSAEVKGITVTAS
jgi:photosystem II stability/assembly factor-like uncharacterized protein